MGYKRLEIYVGWTCNQKCTYCMEFPNMEKTWNKRVTKHEILKKLIKYKRLGYNHVTYLGGEPFIQGVFLDALKIAKKFGFTTLVTTNATTLHLETQAEKYLPYIDELILSVQALDKDLQQTISRTNAFVQWEKVFENIKKHWNGRYLKANIVITQDNKEELINIVNYLIAKNIKNIAVTYPDIEYEYYGEKFVLERVSPSYTEAFKYIPEILILCKRHNIHLKIPDFPFCIFPKENRKEFIKLTDDFDYETRVKLDNTGEILDRKKLMLPGEIPRDRYWEKKCDTCIYKGVCWGPSIHYEILYGLDEIKPIEK